MGPKKFVTKRVEIEAYRYDPSDVDGLIKWSENNFRQGPLSGDEVSPEAMAATLRFTAEVYDKLHDTWIKVTPGQWIVRGAKGEYYPCDDETFHWKYEEVVPRVRPKRGSGEICQRTPRHAEYLIAGETCEFCGYTYD